MVHLGVIGTGNMGSAIVRGIKKGGLEVKIFAFDKDAVKLNALPVAACADEKEVVRRGRYVLLAVKPQLLGGVLETIKDEVTADTVFISICAGVSAEFIRSHTLPSAKVILVMPNTPIFSPLGASKIWWVGRMGSFRVTVADSRGNSASSASSCNRSWP
ncbi:MAG: NAD(P)-binding domain-containing protein [Eubacterium sp.]|nr:NAD(P)-binding domain-containing protein [Eubacterium sp.]